MLQEALTSLGPWTGLLAFIVKFERILHKEVPARGTCIVRERRTVPRTVQHESVRIGNASIRTKKP